MTTLSVPHYTPNPWPAAVPVLEPIGDRGWKMVEVEVIVVRTELGKFYLDRPDGKVALVEVPELLVGHPPFDGRITRPTRVTLTLPTWLAVDTGLIAPPKKEVAS